MGSSLTGGLFTNEETQNHIKVLELKAILFRLEIPSPSHTVSPHKNTERQLCCSGLYKQIWH